jgi:hypothetical protein
MITTTAATAAACRVSAGSKTCYRGNCSGPYLTSCSRSCCSLRRQYWQQLLTFTAAAAVHCAASTGSTC